MCENLTGVIAEKYKQTGRNDLSGIESCFFENRGISNPEEYKHLDENCIIPFSKLDNIEEAVKLFTEYTQKRIHIVVDCDADGITSAAMIYRYIKDVYENTPTYSLHTGKQHGLSEDIKIPEDTELLIIPDAGTNDVEQCKELSEKGVKIIVLDHHIKEIENPYAVVVNNQSSENYGNKEFCGAGVVYKFLQAVDEYEWNNKADEFLDLAALGNISDIMDMRSYETRYLTNKGLKNIHNKAFKAFLKLREEDMGRHVNINAVAFYITPLINAVCRVGTMEEKDLLFRAFCEEFAEFDYKNRKTNKTEKENIFKKCARESKNAKSRQDRAADKIGILLKEQIERYSTNTKPVMFVKADNNIASVFTGLTAMKLASCYKRPCVVLRKDGEIYKGSARNFDNSPIENLKELLQNTGKFEKCAGHENSFGVEIKPENIKPALEILIDELAKNDWRTPVDFIISEDKLTTEFVYNIDCLKDYFATGLKQPTVIIKNITLKKSQCQVMGKEENTWKYCRDDNIEIIKFKCSPADEVLNWLNSDNEEELVVTVFGKTGFNAFGGKLTPRVIIDDYEVIK